MTARYADAWHCYGDPATLARKSRLLDEHADRAGRDPASILRSGSLDLSRPWDDVRRDVDGYRDAGIGYLICGWPSEGEARLDEFVAQHADEIRSS